MRYMEKIKDKGVAIHEKGVIYGGRKKASGI